MEESVVEVNPDDIVAAATALCLGFEFRFALLEAGAVLQQNATLTPGRYYAHVGNLPFSRRDDAGLRGWIADQRGFTLI